MTFRSNCSVRRCGRSKSALAHGIAPVNQSARLRPPRMTVWSSAQTICAIRHTALGVGAHWMARNRVMAPFGKKCRRIFPCSSKGVADGGSFVHFSVTLCPQKLFYDFAISCREFFTTRWISLNFIEGVVADIAVGRHVMGFAVPRRQRGRCISTMGRPLGACPHRASKNSRMRSPGSI